MRRSRFVAPCLALALFTGVLLALAGCGSSGGGSSSSATATSGGSTTEEVSGATTASETASGEVGEVGEGLPEATGGAIASLPKEEQANYKGITENIEASPLGTFKSSAKPPFTIGYASTYAGNTWRATILEYLEEVIVPKYQKLGLIKELKVTQSENDIPTQIQNEKQLLDQGANGLITCCPPPGVGKGVEYAHEQGVPYVSFDGGGESKYALNTGVNYYLAGYEEAKGLAEEINGEGDVVIVSGIQGTAASDNFDAGAEKALAASPGINMAGVIEGDWTDSVAKSETLKFLGTHPQPLAGVVAQAATETGVLQALQQTGREVPPVTIGGEIGPMCYWKNHPEWLTQGYLMWPPRAEIDLGIRSLLKTMLGQGPKIETIARPQFTLTLQEAEKLLPANCSESDTGWVPLDGEEWLPEEQLEGYFKNPFPLADWKSHTGA